MTNARISKTAQAVLRNKELAAAIARALATRSHELVQTGIPVEIDGKIYFITSISTRKPGISGQS